MFNTDLKNKITELERTIDELRNENRELKQKKVTPVYLMGPDDCKFDFKKMNAFSIERQYVNGVSKTIIGYINGDSIMEWFFDTTDEAHAALVAEYMKVK